MAAVASPSDQAADLLKNLSLDSEMKTNEVQDPAPKLSTSQYGSSDLAANAAKPLNQSTTPLHVGPNVSYFPNGYLPTAYSHGGYGGHGIEWNDFSRYVNTDWVEISHGTNGHNGTLMYHQGYGYTPLGVYTSPSSHVPTMGHDGQLYGTQHYQYPGPFYQPQTSTSAFHPHSQTSSSEGDVLTSNTTEKVPLTGGTAAGNPNNMVNTGSVNRNNGSKSFRPSNQYSSSKFNGSNKREGLPTGFPSGYLDPRLGYEGFQSTFPWFDASLFPNGSSRNAGYSSPLNSHLTRPTSSYGQASGFMNLMYPDNRLYGPYGNGAGAAYGSFGYDSWTNGRGWVVVDNKYKPKSRGYVNENVDGLSELNRGPRAKGFKNQEAGPITQTIEGQNTPLTESVKEDNLSQILDRDPYNREDFPEDYSNAKFFVIKSYSEDDVHKSIKYNVWASTPNGNKKLDAAYSEAKMNPSGCPVFLLFSVNTSGQFVGLAEMVGPVDFNKTVEYWQQDKWNGCFPVKWHIIKDVPNSTLRHIILENNENKPVTNSRDTQEVILEKGIQILKIFKSHKGKTSILDDFGFYAARERIMQEKRAKQKTQKQVLDGKSNDDVNDDKHSGATTGKESSDKSNNATLIKEPVGASEVEPVMINEEVKPLEENGSNAAVENSAEGAKSVVSSENKVVPSMAASAC